MPRVDLPPARGTVLCIGAALEPLRALGCDLQLIDTLPDPTALPAPACLVVARQDALQATGAWERFPSWLREARAAGAVVILVFGPLDAQDLAACFRAGLQDAVSADAPASLWRQVVTAALDRLAILAAGRVLQTDSAAAQRQLLDSRRRLRAEANAEADAWLAAQGELERTHDQLRDHMAQVSLLYKFGRELSLASNWDDTLREILTNLANFVGAAGAALVLRAAAGGHYAPRQTYRWQEQSWDKVLLRITREIDAGLASSLLGPGVFGVGSRDGDRDGRITALPLEHQGVRLGILLLMFANAPERQQRSAQHLTFLQMVQVVLSEEVASAQMLDRLRDIGAFNMRVLESVSSGIWVCDGQGRTIFVNRAARGLLGLAPGPARAEAEASTAVGRGRLLDRPLTGGADIDDLPEIFAGGVLRLVGGRRLDLCGLLARKRPFRGDGLLTDAAGEAVPVAIQTAPMAGRDRGERWLMVVLDDQREARRAAEARQRAEQAEALVAMTATLAHEIRNPLTGLSAQAELLRDSLPDDDPRHRRLDLITGEVKRIDRTIADMLQFVRPCEVRPEPVDPMSLIRDCLELAGPRAAARAVALRRDLEDGVLLTCDGTKLKQVVLNLLLNAIDAAPGGGRVVVRLHAAPTVSVTDGLHGVVERAPGVVLDVEDNGPGFGDVDPERLFQPFFTTKTTGTGLGLAYCRKVVEAHGGEIRAMRDGAVTRLRVLLPRETLAGKALAGEAS